MPGRKCGVEEELASVVVVSDLSLRMAETRLAEAWQRWTALPWIDDMGKHRQKARDRTSLRQLCSSRRMTDRSLASCEMATMTTAAYFLASASAEVWLVVHCRRQLAAHLSSISVDHLSGRSCLVRST
jgi:hypothetical protein